MKKLRLLLASTLLLLTGCTQAQVQTNPSNSDGEQEVATHNYEISETELTLKAGQSTKLYISDNGTLVSNITWKSSNTKIAVVDSSGLVTGVKEGEATITGTIDKDNSVNCVVTITSSEVTPPGPDDNKDTEIVKFFKKNADYVSGTSYYFVSSKSKWDYELNQSIIWEMYFVYDTSNDICVINSQMNFTTSSGLSCNYYGYNTFYWGSYKSGLFIGGYNQEKTKGSGTYSNLEFGFDNSTIIFRNDFSLTFVDLSYTVRNNDFTSEATAEDVRVAFSRVSECCSYAYEMFTKFNVNLKLY